MHFDLQIDGCIDQNLKKCIEKGRKWYFLKRS